MTDGMENLPPFSGNPESHFPRRSAGRCTVNLTKDIPSGSLKNQDFLQGWMKRALTSKPDVRRTGNSAGSISPENPDALAGDAD
jgi:hypothetical protein